MNLSGKTVLVTGGAGFIGSSLVRSLLSRECRVVVVDDMRAGSQKHLPEDPMLKVCIQPVGSVLPKFIDQHGIDVVFHLAAEPYIPKSFDQPKVFFDSNVGDSMALYEAVVKSDHKPRVILYSSSELYGDGKGTFLSETSPLNPYSTYAVSKLAQERLAWVWQYERGLKLIIFRQFNCYGPRETHPYVIPEIIRQAVKENVIKLGNLASFSDFVYDDDAAEIACELAQRDDIFGEVINIGTGETHKVSDIAQWTMDVLQEKGVKFTREVRVDQSRIRPLDVNHLLADASKLKKYVDRPFTDFKSGLKKTVEWYLQNGGWCFE